MRVSVSEPCSTSSGIDMIDVYPTVTTFYAGALDGMEGGITSSRDACDDYERRGSHASSTCTAATSLDKNADDVVRGRQRPGDVDDLDAVKVGAPRPWTHAWYHITVSVLGIPEAASLPYAFSYVGWSGGVILIAFATAVSHVSGILLIDLQNSPKLASYSDVADSVMARTRPHFSRNVIRPLQILVFVPITIFIILVLGQTLQALTKVVTPEGSLTTTLWVLVSGVASFLFALIPSIDRMWLASAAGSACGVAGCVLLVVGSAVVIANGNDTDDDSTAGVVVDYGRPPDITDATYAFGILSAFGNLALALGGHSVLPVMQASLGEVDSAKAQASMRKGFTGAYTLLGSVYLVVPCVGYAAFGSTVQPNIMDSLATSAAFASGIPSSDAFLAALYVFTLVNQFVMGGVYIQAGYALFQDLFPTALAAEAGGRRLTMRIAFVGTCTFVAMALPFFGAVAVLTGSLGVLGLTFVVPYVLWLNKPVDEGDGATPARWKRRLTVIVIAICVALGVGGILSGIYFIVIQASTYTFFS